MLSERTGLLSVSQDCYTVSQSEVLLTANQNSMLSERTGLLSVSQDCYTVSQSV